MASAQERSPPATPWQAMRTPLEAPRRPLRLFQRPELVELAQDPLRLLWRRAARTLTHWEGPERIAMEWWRPEAPQAARDYYRAEDEAGRRYWLYCEQGQRPQWFVHGVFT